MPLTGEELYSLLIPIGDERLIVPRVCVAEVVRYPADAVAADASPWRGSLAWRDRDVPVIAFEGLLGLPLARVGGRTRVVVFNPLGGDPDCPPYGILAQGFPQMVRVNSEVVQPDPDYRVPGGAPVICRIAMLSEHALIPDLEMLERQIVARRAASDAAS